MQHNAYITNTWAMLLVTIHHQRNNLLVNYGWLYLVRRHRPDWAPWSITSSWISNSAVAKANSHGICLRTCLWSEWLQVQIWDFNIVLSLRYIFRLLAFIWAVLLVHTWPRRRVMRQGIFGHMHPNFIFFEDRNKLSGEHSLWYFQVKNVKIYFDIDMLMHFLEFDIIQVVQVLIVN